MGIKRRRPVKVLNAVWQLSDGGIESSLVEVLRHLDHQEFQMDFLVASQFEGYYDSTVKKLGARVILGRDSWHHGRNLRELATINKRFGPYDVLHDNIHGHYSGAPLLRAAHQLEIPVRIAHNHTIRPEQDSVLHRAGHSFSRYLTNKHCTHGVAGSRAAAVSLFGPGWECNPRIEVLPRGCNFNPFLANGDPAQVRQHLGIGEGELALVQVGTFNRETNHEFILAVAWELKKLTPNFRILLIGEGPLLEHTQCQVAYAGLSDHIWFLGRRPDVPLLLPAMDAFIFPSLTQAFSIAVVEAQAAGLTCFLSDQIVPEVEVVSGLLRRIPLESGPETWAKEIIANRSKNVSQAEVLEKCLASKLNIDVYIERFKQLYNSALD